MPQLSFDVMTLSMKFGKATVRDLKYLTRLVKRAKAQNCSILIPRMQDKSEWKILVFADAAHSNLMDEEGNEKTASTQGKLVLWVGERGKCFPITWGANKCHRVCRSPVAAETLAAMDGLEEGILSRHFLEVVLDLDPKIIKLIGVTDSRPLDVASHNTVTISDRKMRIDMAAMREGIAREEIYILWRRAGIMLADVFTKKGVNALQLVTLVRTGSLPEEIKMIQ